MTKKEEAQPHMFRLVAWDGSERVIDLDEALHLKWNGRRISPKTLAWLSKGDVISSRTDDGELYAARSQTTLEAELLEARRIMVRAFHSITNREVNDDGELVAELILREAINKFVGVR